MRPNNKERQNITIQYQLRGLQVHINYFLLRPDKLQANLINHKGAKQLTPGGMTIGKVKQDET
jgi:hypothetical protein